MKRRALGENASSFRSIARDYERQGGEANNRKAAEAYAAAPRYRQRPMTKRLPTAVDRRLDKWKRQGDAREKRLGFKR